MKRICVITGTRAEFGIWRPVLDAIGGSKRLELQLLVTGMHLLPAFGNTWRDIGRAGYRIDARVPMYRAGEAPAASLARGIAGMAAAFARLKTDLVMVLGDRLEMLAAASAALASQLPLAHLHGGEIASGQWDEQIRHAITKMAHLHFCATETAGRRIVRMGESPETVHVVGAPALDLARAAAERRAMPPGESRAGALLVLHPSSADAELERRRAAMLVRALQRSGIPFEAIGPNNDPGHAGILRAYRGAKVALTMHLTQDEFWERLGRVKLLIGNSSAGIIEAATFGVPVVNVGDRQAGRERNANVIDVPWKSGAIEGAIAAVLKRGAGEYDNRYGDGHAAERIARLLERWSAARNFSVSKHYRD